MIYLYIVYIICEKEIRERYKKSKKKNVNCQWTQWSTILFWLEVIFNITTIGVKEPK